MTTRWLFGDQLGPHFAHDHRGPLLMVEALSVFRRRRFHRAKAHLVLSAMRHRAADFGDRLTYVRAETYADAWLRSLPKPRSTPIAVEDVLAAIDEAREELGARG